RHWGGTMPASPFELSALRGVITARFPALENASFRLLSEGWDSVAVDVDDRIIFKFPRHERGEAALRREVNILGLVGAKVDIRVPSLALFETPLVFSRHDKIAGNHLVTLQYEALDDAARRALGAAMGHFYAQLHDID